MRLAGIYEGVTALIILFLDPQCYHQVATCSHPLPRHWFAVQFLFCQQSWIGVPRVQIDTHWDCLMACGIKRSQAPPIVSHFCFPCQGANVMIFATYTRTTLAVAAVNSFCPLLAYLAINKRNKWHCWRKTYMYVSAARTNVHLLRYM